MFKVQDWVECIKHQGCVINSTGLAQRNPGYRYVKPNRRNYRFVLVALPFHPAHPGIQIGVVLLADCFYGRSA